MVEEKGSNVARDYNCALYVLGTGRGKIWEDCFEACKGIKTPIQ
jgi:hypothetical protein